MNITKVFKITKEQLANIKLNEYANGTINSGDIFLFAIIASPFSVNKQYIDKDTKEQKNYDQTYIFDNSVGSGIFATGEDVGRLANGQRTNTRIVFKVLQAKEAKEPKQVKSITSLA